MHKRLLFTRSLVLAGLVAGSGLLVATGGSVSAAPPAQQGTGRVERPLVDRGVSRAADARPPLPDQARSGRERENPVLLNGAGPDAADAAQQTTLAPAASVVPSGAGFDGLGLTDSAFQVKYAPPDTNGDVSSTQYVQSVNSQFAVYNLLDGTRVQGARTSPFNGSSLFSGFNGPGEACAKYDDGDPVVQYDRAADKWILTQFQVTVTPYLECVAVSKTNDAAGDYYVYAYSYGTDFVDYPKVGVWSSAYVVTYNVFANGRTFTGGEVCALPRAALIAGSPGQAQQCFKVGSSYGGLLPSDDDTGAPIGDPYLVNMTGGRLYSWRLHPAFNGGVASISSPLAVSGVGSFSSACSGGGTCIPQPKTQQKLDSLGDRLMNRLAYQVVNDQPALVVSHAVSVGSRKSSSTAVRWYQLRTASGDSLSVVQQGTYAPDTTSRWMSSAAMDKNGAIAVGYSLSSSSVYPSIGVALHTSSDAGGALGAEQIVKAGRGSQVGSNLSRWGDYASMSVAPDGCTMWFTTEYLTANGAWNWSTYITSFKMPNCS